ncbi:MAG: phosphoribosylformylglycinamidine cyclo-ligase [Candidatus Omnitrophica bacterium]|nr:phosphoribosylformylglycinamidine cyclo-ligase [Candidatus Omnitrophota bacterium]MDD5488177.1 phosphoribosylformylglycinamidine cyclo-ligase [Candidatus Omnitrophota bacterium]
MTYKRSGVDIDRANKLIKNIKGLIDTTRVRGSMDSIGGFGAFFDPSKYGIKDPLLVASTDGVGTKLRIAQITGVHDTIGIDLVAMCVNDTLCCGARPVFFLDYFATGKLEDTIWTEVVKGIIDGCRQAGCALLGGETAEMPGMYARGEYDLAGFTVGIVDRKKLIDGKKTRKGDIVLGLASSGLHSNGYSMVRKIFTKSEMKKHRRSLLAPTEIYVRSFLGVHSKYGIKGAANITGGGFYDNIPRMLPRGMKAVITMDTWEMPGVFGEIKKKADITEREMYRTFNMGIGMALVMSPKDANGAKRMFWDKFGIKSWIIGHIDKGPGGVELVK